MFSVSNQRSATALLLYIILISLSPVLSQDAKCTDELNPFNIRPYRVPEEAPKEPKEELLIAKEKLNYVVRQAMTYIFGNIRKCSGLTYEALYWIAREDLGCAANHNDDLKKKVNFTRSAFPDIASRVFISEKCQDHVKFWLDRVIKVVQHNLLVTMKIKAIHFFQPNQYQSFKNFQFKRSHITSLPLDQILRIIDKTGQDLKNGLTLPGNEKLPSYEAYNETFSEVLRVYGGIYHALIDLRDVVFNRVNGCDNKDTQCLEQLYKTLIGESNDWSGRVLGYTEIRKIVEEGIRVVIAAFLDGTSERDNFDGLKLPMMQPCFST